MKHPLTRLTLLLLFFSIGLQAQTREEAYYTGVSAYVEKDYQKAITNFTKVINSDYKEFLAIAYNYRGLCKKHLGQLTGAKNDFLKGIEVQHENRFLHNNLANIYYNARKYELAIEHFSIALSFDKSNSTICTNLANAYFQLEMYNTAKKYYLKALENEPNNEVAQIGVEQVEHLQNLYGRPIQHPAQGRLNVVQDMGVETM